MNFQNWFVYYYWVILYSATKSCLSAAASAKPMSAIAAKITIMNKKGPIIVIEDDADDRDLLKSAFSELRYENEVVFFSDGEKCASTASKRLQQGDPNCA